jgi:D-inositol-3-phosphate glycosyltransferase
VPRGPVSVRGWHAFGDRPAVAVVVTFGPHVQSSALVGEVERPDVAAALGQKELARSGWAMVVDLSDVPAGPVDMHVTVWGGPHQSPVDAGAVPVVVGDDLTGKFEGMVDDPRETFALDELIPGFVTITGWVIGDDGPVDQVEVLVDGRSTGRARLGVARPDVFTEHPVPWALSSGFEQQVDLGGVAEGSSVRISAVARQSNGTDREFGERVLPIMGSPFDRTKRTPTSARLEVLRSQLPRLVASLPSPPTDDLNLLVVTHQLDYGGAQLWLTELLEKSGAGRDFPCTILSQFGGPLISDLVDAGIDVHVTRPFVVNDLEQYEGQVAELGTWARARGHNAVLANTFGSLVGADMARRLSWPAAWAIHESWSPPAFWSMAYPPGYVDPKVRRIADQVLAATPALIFEAEATRRLYLSETRPGAALVVPYGIDTARIEKYCAGTDRLTVRRELELPENGRILLVMGTVEPRKAQLLIAQAFAGIAQKYPETTLVFVGYKGNAYAETLKTFVETIDLGEQIRIVPVVSDPFPWYRSADVVLCASDIESLPRSVLDAMCFGATIVATSVFGLPELLTDGETGFLFEPRSLSALVAALHRVLDMDISSLHEIGAAGQRHVLRHYDSRGYALDILAILRGLLQDPSRAPGELVSR